MHRDYGAMYVYMFGMRMLLDLVILVFLLTREVEAVCRNCAVPLLSVCLVLRWLLKPNCMVHQVDAAPSEGFVPRWEPYTLNPKP